jgi:hypothetical protein
MLASNGMGNPANSAPGHRKLVANGWYLIANETHSREKSSVCKQNTYKILIANEFHLQRPAQNSTLLDRKQRAN